MDHLLLLAIALTSTPTPSPVPYVIEVGSGGGFSLAGIATGAVGAALLGILGAWISSLREHAKWVREERLQAYLGMLTLINGISNRYVLVRSQVAAGNTVTLDEEKMLEDFPSAFAALDLLGPVRMSKLAHTLSEAIMKQGTSNPSESSAKAISAAKEAFSDAARKVLKISDK